MRKNGVVFMRGMAKSGVIGTSICTLPAGYRPTQGHMQAAISNSAICRLEIETDGTVTPVNGSNVFVSLGGVCFPAEA
jgi:hypothetical protein